MASESERTYSILIPLLLPGQTRPDPDENSANNPSPDGQTQDQRVINPQTQVFMLIEGTGIDTLFRTPPEKEGQPPASKSAIQAMPSVEIREDDDGECSICLMEWSNSNGGIVKEMPCKHRFHGGCIEKWLGIHGSCPVCRHSMPAEEREKEEEEEREEREILVRVSFWRVGRTGEERESGDVGGSDSEIGN